MERLNYIARHEGRFALTGAPDGYDAYLAAESAGRRNGLIGGLIVATSRQNCEWATEYWSYLVLVLYVAILGKQIF